MDRRKFIEEIFNEYIKNYNLQVSLSFEMPKGFENAFGMFDGIKNVLYINILDRFSLERVVYTFFHELRHALQYNYPENFCKEIQITLPYVLHYDGNCYMLKNNKWLHCKIDENYNFVEIYKSFPYELDANNFAYKQAIEYLKTCDGKEIDKIYKDFIPNKRVEINEIMKICEIIENKCNNVS